MVVDQEPHEVPGLGHVARPARRSALVELGGQGERPLAHGGPILHRRPYVGQYPEEAGAQLVHAGRPRLAVDLDVDERLPDPVAVAQPGEVVVLPGHGDDGVDDEVEPAALAGELHAHRVDQEGHVVGDDLDDRVGRRPAMVVEGRCVDPYPGGARLPLLGQVEVGQGGTIDIDRVAAHQVLGGDPFPVAAQEGLGQVGLSVRQAGAGVGRRFVDQRRLRLVQSHDLPRYSRTAPDTRARSRPLNRAGRRPG